MSRKWLKLALVCLLCIGIVYALVRLFEALSN